MARFLADESCDFRIVRTLRSAGHDVVAISETARGATDEVVIALAVEDNRILVTEDTDFGQLVYARGHQSSGVILIRFPGSTRASLSELVRTLVDETGERLNGAFVVMQPGRTRISRPR